MLGWVTGIGAAVALVANPVAGALSDRTTSRFGRRRPWIVCGALAGAAALAFLAGQRAIAGVIVGWCLAQAGLNAMQASLTACVPDHVPVAQRGVVSAWIGLPATLSALVSGLVMALGAVILALWPSWHAAIGVAAIIGLRFGVYLSVDQALVTQVLPSAAGRAKDRHHQHCQHGSAGAGPGDRCPAGQPVGRVSGPVPDRGRGSSCSARSSSSESARSRDHGVPMGPAHVHDHGLGRAIGSWRS